MKMKLIIIEQSLYSQLEDSNLLEEMEAILMIIIEQERMKRKITQMLILNDSGQS